MNNPLRRLERSIEPAPTGSAGHRSVSIILWQLLTTIEIIPVPPPAVPENLTSQPLLLQIHGCVRLFLLDIEHAISPGGHLRGLTRLACRIGLVAAVISLCASAILACAAVVVSIAEVLTGQLVLVLWHLLQAAVLLMALLATATLIFVIVGFFARTRRSDSSGPEYRRQR
jgi:hypothetical protein